jgi:hypothetical protein
VTPGEILEDDVEVKAGETTFVLATRDAQFLEQLGGVMIDESRFWSGLTIRPLYGGGCC